MTAPVLSLRGLTVRYGGAPVVQDVAFDLYPGEMLALVGLSGCGKTTVLRALLGLLPPSARVAGTLDTPEGQIDLGDRRALRARLGQRIGFVPQNPFDACAPHRSVQAHVEEAWRARGLAPDPARLAALAGGLGLDPAALGLYPHQWSGGMLQRANVAAAVALDPPVVVADEPTSALDADNADATVACLRDGRRAVLLVSHDLGLVARQADRVALLLDGRIAAQVPAGVALSPTAPPALRDFARLAEIARPPPPAAGAAPVIAVQALALARGGRVLARGLSFALRPGEVLCVRGPSGSGKSTLLAVLAGRLPPAAGEVLRAGQARPPHPGEVLPLFQDALSSMNPRWDIARVVAEPLTIGPNRRGRVERRAAAHAALADLGLGHLDPRLCPGAVSTGQAQRVALARAILARPRLILADEPTSALDPRQRGRALDGLRQIATAGAAIILVSHDAALAGLFGHHVLDLSAPHS
ncbi:MAG: ABC transporter ATP-binding protein [Gemmobacter sp.]